MLQLQGAQRNYSVRIALTLILIVILKPAAEEIRSNLPSSVYDRTAFNYQIPLRSIAANICHCTGRCAKRDSPVNTLHHQSNAFPNFATKSQHSLALLNLTQCREKPNCVRFGNRVYSAAHVLHPSRAQSDNARSDQRKPVSLRVMKPGATLLFALLSD
jgi:hypothetical protein